MATSFRFLISLFTVLLLLAAASMPAFSQTLDQQVTADSLKAGDIFEFSITLKKDRTYDRVIYPDSSSFTDDFELRDRRQYRVADFKDSLRYELQFWATDSATLPALPVKLINGNDTTTLYTDPVTIGFQSVLESENEELRPLKPIFDFAAAWWPYILGLLIILLLAAAAYYYYKKYRAQSEAEPEPTFSPQPFLNPLKELENNLRQLKDVSLTSKEHFEQYYISLGDAIRLYFEQMYGIPALESTSREIVRDLDRRAIDERLVKQTRIVLREADMVKFANFTPTEDQARKTFQKANEFLTIAKEVHGPRIEQKRQQHFAKVEQARRAFQEKQKENKES